MKMILKQISIMSLLILSAVLMAHGGSAMGTGGMTGSSGMLVIADDGSLLLLDMDSMQGTMDGSSAMGRELVNIGPDGQERWRVAFEEGWPMMPVTAGNLVILTLADDWWMGDGDMGDGDWDDMHDRSLRDGDDEDHVDESIIVALNLSTGEEAWRTVLDGDMASTARFSPDGTRIYISLMEMGEGNEMGTGSMNQGEAAGTGSMMSSAIVALDLEGNILWIYEDDDSHQGGGMDDTKASVQ